MAMRINESGATRARTGMASPPGMQAGDTDVRGVFEAIAAGLPRARVAFLLVGGFAVNHYGYTRGTLDIDFLIAGDALPAVRDFMLQAGFTNWSTRDVVTCFNRPGSRLRVDFLHTDSDTFQRMMRGAVPVDLLGSALHVPALPDLIAMKLFAAHHGGRTRADKDLPDVAFLAVLNDLDPERDLHPLCRRYASESIYADLCRRISEIAAP